MVKRILVVDDEPDIVDVVSFSLQSLGYETLVAVDGESAIESLQREKPDLMLLDLGLPVIDGFEVCRRVRADEDLKDIPIILFTASDTEAVICKGKSLGANDYILKPYDPELLKEKIEKYI